MQNIELEKLLLTNNHFELNKIIIDYVKEIVCKKYGIEKGLLCKKTRIREIVKARQVSMYLLRSKTDIYLNDIAKAFNMDHCSVIHANHQINNYLFYDKEMKQQIDELKTLIELKIKALQVQNSEKNGYYYADLSDFKSCKIQEKVIILSGYSDEEIEEFKKINNINTEFKTHNKTGMYILEKDENGE